jgi:hypothetical protein
MSDLVEISTDGIHSCQFEYWPNQKKMKEIYIRFDGRRIAYRGHPDTPQAGSWVAIDKRYLVRDENDCDRVVVEWNHEHAS